MSSPVNPYEALRAMRIKERRDLENVLHAAVGLLASKQKENKRAAPVAKPAKSKE
jgi:hypothetical protein